MLVEGHTLTMEIDTGAAVSKVSKDTVNSSPFLKCLPLQQTDVNLRTYTGQPVSVLGQLLVKVQHDEAQETIPLQVVKGGGTEVQHYWVETGCKNFDYTGKIFSQTTYSTHSTGSPG